MGPDEASMDDEPTLTTTIKIYPGLYLDPASMEWKAEQNKSG
jgi:hypothetical protein